MAGKLPSKKVSLTRRNEVSADHVTEAVSLRRELGIFGGISMIMGGMIGSGIFISPKGVLQGASSVGLALLLWTGGGLISLCGALSFAELGTMIPKSGGEYVYLLETTHPAIAFLFMFITVVLLKPAALGILALTFSEYFLGVFYTDDCGAPPVIIKKLLAIAVLLTLVAVNIYSVRMVNRIQVFFAGTKLLALIIIIVGGLVNLGQGHTKQFQDSFEGTNENFGQIALGLYSSMWAYAGWDHLNTATEELERPSKTLPRSICIAVPLVICVYLLSNISYFTALSTDDLLASHAVALSWAEVVMPGFAWLIPIFVCVSTFGTASVTLFGSGRVAYSAAREGHMVKLLSFVQVNNLTPTPAILFCGCFGMLMVIPTNIGSLIQFYNFANWIFYGFLFSVTIYMKLKFSNIERPFKVPLIVPALALLASVFLVVGPIVLAPQIEFLYVLGYYLVGLAIYLIFIHFKWSLPGLDKVTQSSMLLLQVVKPNCTQKGLVLSLRVGKTSTSKTNNG